MTFACVLLFGVLPAFRATRVDLATSLRSQGRTLIGAARVGSVTFGRVLVVAQIALSMLLLIGGGLLVRSMQQLLHSDLGFDRDHVVAVKVRTVRSQYVGARLAELRRDLAERARQIPGVDAAAFAEHGVFSGGSSGGHVDVPGFVPQADSERIVSYDRVGPNYLHAIGAHLVRGRDIEVRDLVTVPQGAVINETMAKRYFGDRNPLGGSLVLDSTRFSVVGVVRDFQNSDVRDKPRRMFYYGENDSTKDARNVTLMVRVRGDVSRYVEPLRRAVADADRNLPASIEPLNDRVRDTLSQDVLLVQVTTFFCLMTLVLASLGLYGVTAYATTQRTGEFGLRAALGAEPNQITVMVLGEAVKLALTGIVIGVPIGLGAVRLIRSQLFGVGAIDFPSLMVALLVLVGAAVIASYLPARRAARIGPLEALRGE
jgi:predicted permease